MKKMNLFCPGYVSICDQLEIYVIVSTNTQLTAGNKDIGAKAFTDKVGNKKSKILGDFQQHGMVQCLFWVQNLLRM